MTTWFALYIQLGVVNNYRKLLKICILLWGKSGEGAFARIFSLSRAYVHPTVPHTITQQLPQLSGWTAALIKLMCTQEISSAYVKTKEWKQIASSVVTGDLRKFVFPVRAAKTLVVASEWGYSTFVCVCVLQTQSTMPKACPEDARYGVFTRGKIPRQELGD